ncbi:MAG: hypothetical protein FJW23_08680 [Acidimicrobiia bacterium]|nr:hypothetical protein [Acidimicrobiia bacterium]
MSRPPKGPLTLQQCREFVAPDCPLDDQALLALRDDFYAFSRVIFASLRECTISFEVASAALDADQRAAIEERAAILEFDGRLSRQEAERCALAEVPLPKAPVH